MDTDCVFIFERNSYDKYRLLISEFHNFRTKFTNCFDIMQPKKPTSTLKITGEKLNVPKFRINCILYIPPRWYHQTEEVVGLMSSDDSESYADGSVATGKVSHAGQVKGDDPNIKRHPGPAG
jgi:hypothetical protein